MGEELRQKMDRLTAEFNDLSDKFIKFSLAMNAVKTELENQENLHLELFVQPHVIITGKESHA